MRSMTTTPHDMRKGVRRTRSAQHALDVARASACFVSHARNLRVARFGIVWVRYQYGRDGC